MALRTYQHNTLNDNWFEERAPKLNGVLADYGHRVFSTVHTEHFVDPKDTSTTKPAQIKRLASSKPSALTMTREDTFANAIAMRETMKPISSFKHTLPKKNPIDEERYLGTTYKDGYGHVDRAAALDATNKMLLQQPDAPWAKGMAGQRVEKGCQTSGAIGEVFKYNLAEPEKHTPAQRAWLYSEDPLITLRRDGFPEEKAVEGMTLPLKGGNASAYDPNGRYPRTAGISRHTNPIAPPLPGTRVFKDDP